MAYSFPSAVSTGDVLTASAYNQAVQENQKFGIATFTTEASRDAAITSPSEGMRAYLTGPTVPAATGTTTAVPTGVMTVYNGSVWVCTTPVASSSGTDGTTTSASYVTTLTGDATAIAVTLVTGTTALVSLNTTCNNSTSGQAVYASVSVSGATTLAAADDNGVLANAGINSQNISLGRTYVLTGLTAGTNTFTLNYKVTANTGTYSSRSLVVQGVA